jgi:hypothetical protein
MRRVTWIVMAGVFATGLLANAQDGDADRILAAARQALGGDARLTAIKSLTATGHNNRGEVEMAVELPDKFLKKEVFAQVMDISLARTSGFNGAGLIDEMDRKTVEFRLLYSDYKDVDDVDGVKFPFTISRSVDGQPQESLTLEKVKINPKIDPKKFDISK